MSKIDRKTSIGLTIGALAVGGGLLYILTRRRGKSKASQQYGPQTLPMAVAPALEIPSPTPDVPRTKQTKKKPTRLKPKPKPQRPKPPTPPRPDDTMPNELYRGYYRDRNGDIRYADRGKSIINRSAIMAPVFAVEPPNRERRRILPELTRAPMNRMVPMVIPSQGFSPQRMAIASAKPSIRNSRPVSQSPKLIAIAAEKPRIRNSRPVSRLPQRPLIKNIHATTVATNDEMLRSVRLHPVRNIQRGTSQPRHSKRTAVVRPINRRAPRGFAMRPAVKPKGYRNGRAEMMRPAVMPKGYRNGRPEIMRRLEILQ